MFEEQVAKAISNHGYQVDPQVGVAGFFIDLGVVDPEKPGRYLLGIECDGATYHSARWARDRDRLREQVLVDKGWIIHRIWSADWFQRPDGELRRALAAIEKAKIKFSQKQTNAPVEQDSGSSHPTKSSSEGSILQREMHADSEVDPNHVLPYVEANDISVPSYIPLHEVYESTMANIVTEIVKVEGPVHQEIIARRVSSLWGLTRTGNRINNAVLSGINKARRRGHLKGRGSYVIHSDQTKVRVRNREEVDLLILKKPQYLPPTELTVAFHSAIKTNIGISRDEASKVVSIMVGLKSMSAQFRKQMEDVISDGINKGFFVEDGNKLRLGKLAPSFL